MCAGVIADYMTVPLGASVIQPVAVIRDLGVLFEQELSMTQHIDLERGTIVLLPTASTPSDTSSSRPGAHRLAGLFVRSIEV